MNRFGTLMVVDDDPDVLTAAKLLLKPHFHRIRTSVDPADIDDALDNDSVDIFLLDMNFAIGRNSGAEGLEWLQRILAADPDAVVVLMTAFGDLNTAVEAMRRGAADFVLKPWQNDRLIATLQVAAELRRSRVTVSAIGAPPPAPAMIAESPAMQRVLRMIERVAPTDANVLVRGENGTGKELVAQAIHRQSGRARRAMIAVDLGAIPETLFESELFGHRKGAFTDAIADRAGRFQAAHGGTLFLDEIGNLPASLQTRLLRVLESRQVVPVGSDDAVDVDVRLITATNQPLERLVDQKRFREDLLYRINTIQIELPPLRERKEDIEPLVRHFAARITRRYGMAPAEFATACFERLRAYDWPGNVRELSHAVERALILADTNELGPGDFDLGRSPADAADTADLDLEANEKRLIERALADSDGNISRAARVLGITRASLYRRIEKFGI